MDFAQAEKQAENLLSFVKEVRKDPRHPVAYNQDDLAIVLEHLRQADDALKLLIVDVEQPNDLEFMEIDGDKMEVDDEQEGYGDLVGKASCYVIVEKAVLEEAKTPEERRRAVVKYGEVSQRLACERWYHHLRKCDWLNKQQYEMRIVKTWISADLPQNFPSCSELALAGEFALETQKPTFKQNIIIPKAGRKIERLDNKAKRLASDEKFKADVIACLDDALQSDESVVIEERYLCPFGCKGDGFINKNVLVDHLKEKHPIGKVELFDCEQCDKKGMTKRQLKNHKTFHNKAECPYKGFDGCNANPMRKGDVARHCKSKHPKRVKKTKKK
ncbi:hypothetical protein M3Y97_00828500 [Aphelenchoides bicaudatus]|nr:hypothetical protein M3Y97_00828500 [Aphelenchoides bicaudatus]